MSIVTTNPARITVQLIDYQSLNQERIFKLAHFIDAYEIEKKLQESLVIDIYEISKAGRIELLLTPKSGLTYDEISEHIRTVIAFALDKVNLSDCKWEIEKISFETQKPGKPSYVFDGDHSAFKAE
ncbi:hypothetical protein [[Eubacterium] cellulosolvens]